MFIVSRCDNIGNPNPQDFARGSFYRTCVTSTTNSPTASPSLVDAEPSAISSPYSFADREDHCNVVDLYLAGLVDGI